MIGLIFQDNLPRCFDYSVMVDPMIADGYVIDHAHRRVIFAYATARSICRRVRRRFARGAGRRNAVRVPDVSFAVALGAYISRGSMSK